MTTLITGIGLVGTAERLLPKLQVEIIPGKPPHSVTQPMSFSQAKQFLGWEPSSTWKQDLRISFKSSSQINENLNLLLTSELGLS